VTREALALYLRKLAPGGVVAFHISNLYLELAPTLGALAADAGLVCSLSDDAVISEEDASAGKLGSRWLVMARRQADMGALATDARWVPVQAHAGAKVWTDDFSNPLSIIKWD
jgi:hypothetical protein